MRRWRAVVAVVAMVAWVGVSAAWAQAGQDKPAPPAASQGKAEPASADPVSGDWDGAVEAGGNTIGFTLKLKLDKERVTGEISSDQGTLALSDGAFTGGKLSLAFAYPDGTPITMTGTLSDGQVTGTLSFGGQPMSWAAKKRAAK